MTVSKVKISLLCIFLFLVNTLIDMLSKSIISWIANKGIPVIQRINHPRTIISRFHTSTYILKNQKYFVRGFNTNDQETQNKMIMELRKKMAEDDHENHMEFVNRLDELWKKGSNDPTRCKDLSGLKRLAVVSDLEDEDIDDISEANDNDIEDGLAEESVNVKNDSTSNSQAEQELIDAFMEYFKLTKVEVTPQLLEKRREMRKMYPDLYGDITDEELGY